MGVAVDTFSGTLKDRLPAVRGRLDAQASLARYTWFKVGGAAEVLFRPADLADLRDFLAAKPAEIPLTVIGMGSNLLVRDGGVPGVVVRLGRPFATITVDGTRVRAGASALDYNVALAAQQANLSGLEFLSGIPGAIGGAVRMNAGAYGREFRDVLCSASALDPQGQLHHLTVTQLDMGYRHCGVPEDWIFVTAELQGEAGDGQTIAQAMADIRRAREDSQPLGEATGGSTFRNPPGASAWRLIDQAGCRGACRGGAEVSTKHSNFLINRGGASAADIEGLGEHIRQQVFQHSGVMLEWEIRRIGVALNHQQEDQP